MIKRTIILVVLSAVLFILVKSYLSESAATASNNPKIDVSTKYKTVEYKIIEINGNEYYGKAADGTGIYFTANNIFSGDIIQVNDTVICYFDKENIGDGLVKVEKKR